VAKQLHPQHRLEEPHEKALAALRSQAAARFFPASSSPATDTSVETLPRIVGTEIAWRSRLIEELAALQMLLISEAMRPLTERRPDSLSSLVREIRGLIKDQREIVEKAPLGLTVENAKTQVRDALERHALLAAELRRRGLGKLLDQIAGRGPGKSAQDVIDQARPIHPSPEVVASPEPPDTVEGGSLPGAAVSVTGEGGSAGDAGGGVS
jgi:hypothetical protein